MTHGSERASHMGKASKQPRADAPERGPAGVVSVVLAAGRGARLGGPKALLLWSSPEPGAPELPLAIAHAEARLAAESDRVLVVSRRPIVNALLGYVRPGIDLLSSDAADELGPAGSLAFAVSKLEGARAVLVTPVDTPPARADTVARLLERLDRGDPALRAVRPRYQGRAGHPVVLHPSALEPYRKASPPPLRDHLRTLGAACADVDVDDRTVLVDLDSPPDVMSLLGRPPKFLAA